MFRSVLQMLESDGCLPIIFDGLVSLKIKMTPRTLRRFCKLDSECEKQMENAIIKLGLSARAYDRVLRVSRTIADLEQSEKILPRHVSEAIQYRTLDRTFWQ